MEKHDHVVVVPSDAILRKPGGKSVAFVVEKNTARMRPVVTGIESGGKVEIVSGINAGEKLVIRGHEMLKDGAQVKAKQPKQPMGGGSKPKGGAQ
jgi:multidrug efflux pump subunit AcrA (membrane-fusion protein)